MKKFLLTGGTTFVSKYTAEYFVKKGYDVTVLNRGSRPQVSGVTHINCDRTQLGDLLRGKHFDAILDITAYTEEQDCGRNSIWGDYGTNKLQAEEYLRENVPNAYMLRPPYFYGKYENLYREGFVFDCAMRDRPFYLPGDGSMKLQFFHVRDLCRFVEILLEKHPERKVFNVGNPETVTVKEWAELCYRIAGKTPRFVSVDRSVFQRNYFCFHDYEYVLDVSRQSALMPDTMPLEQGLKEEFEWFRDNPDSVYRRNPYMEYIDSNL